MNHDGTLAPMACYPQPKPKLIELWYNLAFAWEKKNYDRASEIADQILNIVRPQAGRP